jgi:hypothetical protein
MISLAGSLTPARISGWTAHGFALASCAMATAKTVGDAQRRRLARALTLLEIGLVLDYAFNARWWLHGLLENVAIAKHVYGERFGPQVAALCLLAGATVMVIDQTPRRWRGRPGASVAVCGAILSLFCWCVEVISLHATDAVFNYTFAGATVVSLCWAVCSLMTGLGILWDAWAVYS